MTKAHPFPTSKRELFGYFPLLLVMVVTAAMAATTVAFNLGG
ncbi:MAG: hypothetical protein ACRDZQ_01275 [Acidimicrobiales bacterium]